MAQDTIKKITEYKNRIADLEREMHGQLAKLPAQYGFASAEEFIAAFRKSVAGKPGRKPGKAVKAKVAKAGKDGRKARVKITAEIEAQVKSLTEAGKTGKEIAKVTGVSLPSVGNIKKKLGLVGKK